MFLPPFIITLTIPFAIIGISAEMLSTGAPFGFTAMLGTMSLAGMMIKNAIVLVVMDQFTRHIIGFVCIAGMLMV